MTLQRNPLLAFDVKSREQPVPLGIVVWVDRSERHREATEVQEKVTAELGTPAGVGPLLPGDRVEGVIAGIGTVSLTIEK